MNKQHKWAGVIKAWADGQSVQFRICISESREEWGEWMDFPNKLHHTYSPWDSPNAHIEWRVKPEVQTGWVNIFSTDIDGVYMGNTIHETRAQALEHLPLLPRVAVIQISWTEGEGLT